MSTTLYSDIVAPEEYNRQIGQHLYISDADEIISAILHQHVINLRQICELLELGPGPARLLPLLSNIPGTNLTGIDHDPIFVDYGRSLLQERRSTATLLQADVLTYKHPKKIDAVVSQGFHHHVPKGHETIAYLANVRDQLSPQGIYVLGDEFLPHYENKEMRYRKAVIWYSHIIAHALRNGHEGLAKGEAETLQDELSQCDSEEMRKHQTPLILEWAPRISQAAQKEDWEEVNQCVEVFIGERSEISMHISGREEGTQRQPVPSRGDFKICHAVFQKEVEEAGFQIIGVSSIGPIHTIGAMVVYTLKVA